MISQNIWLHQTGLENARKHNKNEIYALILIYDHETIPKRSILQQVYYSLPFCDRDVMSL